MGRTRCLVSMLVKLRGKSLPHLVYKISHFLKGISGEGAWDFIRWFLDMWFTPRDNPLFFFQVWRVEMVDGNVGVPVTCSKVDVYEDESKKTHVQFKYKEEGSFKISDTCKWLVKCCYFLWLWKRECVWVFTNVICNYSNCTLLVIVRWYNNDNNYVFF